MGLDGGIADGSTRSLAGKRVGFALTGSFCTFRTVLECMEEIKTLGADITPIISHAVDTMDTRFYEVDTLKEMLTRITGKEVIRTIPAAEPIGPQRLFDIMVVLPATGNTLAKLACGITDTAVTMAVKSHLRNNGPVVLGISTNDALGNAAQNIGRLFNMRNLYFVPFCQDDPAGKPRSMVFKREYVIRTMESALNGEQLQPMIVMR